MAMSLSDAIANGIQIASQPSNGSEAFVIMTMHDAEGPVLYGVARPLFVSDLALRGSTGTGTIGGGGKSGVGGWFTRQPTPGFSSRGRTGFESEHYYLTNLSAGTYPYQPFNTNQRTAMDFSVRRDPGIPLLQWIRGGPSIQIEIEAGAKAVTLNAEEDGLYLRATGPSIEDPSHRAGYTVTLDWSYIVL